MAICIPKDLIEKVQALNLKEMDSISRTKALSEILGSENGKEVNKLFEKRLTLVNQKVAMNRFVDDLSGVTTEKKLKLKENIAKRLDTKQQIIEDKELLTIVQEGLNKKYKIDIPDETVADLMKIKKEADKLKVSAIGTPDGSDAKLVWGQKLNEYDDVIDAVARASQDDLKTIVKQSLIDSATRIKQAEGVLGKTGQTLKEVIRDVFTVPAKGIKAAWDASYIFRQGLKVLTADPKIWGKQVKGSLGSWTKVYDKAYMKEIVDAFKADIRTRDLYQDAINSGLALGVKEDFFPTNVAEKIPLLGNLFKASDDSFTMFSQGSRMDLFEKYVNQVITETGEKPSADIMKGLAKYVNGLTGRGGLGTFESSSGFLNQLFFSARYQVANLKTFADPLLSKTPEVRAIAAKNLARHTAFVAGTMLTLSAVTDVGFDPRSNTFGKARIPGSKKWIDITGGLASYWSLLGRSYDAASKKPQYGKDTAMDIFTDFLKGKLAPVPGAFRDILEQRDYSGRKPTALTTLESLFVPISASNVIENAKDKEELDIQALSAFFDILGAGVTEPKSKGEGSYWSPFK
jgi:hypothetical protein